MEDWTGRIVRAGAGRDKGRLFAVAGVEAGGEYLLLVDGKRRPLERPKRKKPRHVSAPDQGAFSHPVLDALRAGQPVSNRALRRALAAFRAQPDAPRGVPGEREV